MKLASHVRGRRPRPFAPGFFRPQVVVLECRLPLGETLLGVALCAAWLDAPEQATIDPFFAREPDGTLPALNLPTVVDRANELGEPPRGMYCHEDALPLSRSERATFQENAVHPGSAIGRSNPENWTDLLSSSRTGRIPLGLVANGDLTADSSVVSMVHADNLSTNFLTPSMRVPPAAMAPLAANMPPSTSNVAAGAKPQMQRDFGRLPISFEANVGQADPNVQFLTHGPGYTLFLANDDAVMVLQQGSRGSGHGSGIENPMGIVARSASEGPSSLTPDLQPQTPATVVRMQVLGGNSAVRAVGEQPQRGTVNYFLGNDPSQWHTNIATFGQVRYPNIYPGIDLTFYASQQQLEYDFVVAPGADPSRIRLGFSGADSLALDAHGDLLVSAKGQEILEHKPVVFQNIRGVRQEIPSAFTVTTGQIAFALGRYDPSQPLVIDPVLSYSTYLGGNGYDQGQAIATDEAGNAYVTGIASSVDFPIVNAFQQNLTGFTNAFVTKIAADGSSLLYSTYLGGSGVDQGLGIAVDSAGNAYVAGYTGSTDFPTVNALQPVSGGLPDAFVASLTPDGSALRYSTYLGGSGADGASGIAVDGAGNAYVTGYTRSADFPTANALQPALRGSQNAFVAKLAPDGSALVYSTYLGGSTGDSATAIAVDPDSNAYVTGTAYSSDFPAVNALQPALRGGTNGFVSKIAADGSNLLYSTYLGGSHFDYAYGIAADGDGNAYVVGGTNSADFPTANAFQPVLVGQSDAFLSKIAADGSALVYSTYLGGSGSTGGGAGARAVAVDGAGNAYVTGLTSSENFPLVDPIQSTYGGGDADVFVTKFNADGSALVYSTFLGGNQWDYGFGIAVDRDGNAYITGLTESTNFPTIHALQALPPGNGIFKTTSSGDNWLPSSSGLTNGDIRAFALDPSNPALIYAGTNGGGVFLSSDAGQTWNPTNMGLTNSVVRALVTDPLKSAFLYAGTDGGIFKSADGGATWTASSTGLTNLAIRSMVVDREKPATLYAATAIADGGGVFISTDGGAHWNLSNEGLEGVQVIHLAIDPKDPSILYAGTARNGLSKSTDGGASWHQSNAGLPVGYNGRRDIQTIEIDPATPSTLYASVSYFPDVGYSVSEVYKSTDAGMSWSFSSSGIAGAYAFAIDPVTTGTLYAATGSGVYKSVDGATWQPTGLNRGYVYAIALDPTAPATLYAGAVRYPISAFVAKISS